MKTIGLLGGMSWESTTQYYRLLNEIVRAELGGLHSAKILMYSVDFEELVALKHQGDWSEIGNLLATAAAQLEGAGAECILLATNTMHKVADAIALSTEIPLIHIADATAEEIKRQSIQRVGLLGTRFTMEESFYKDRLVQQHGLDVLVPNKEARDTIHDIIYDELCLGQIRSASRDQMRAAVSNLFESGAEAIILGCTEIGLLIGPEDSAIPLFDTTAIHANAAIYWAIESDHRIKR
ncbi:aspartate/glutamate racemase family protein [cf. Phormidesmis sp. LEGE 11477]|uniref:aspartate/glutamate racemase family protein n=1 Tax=cf. Phormidesmis sp. LEGE 11477 TaxID=1828680 RepID=UPI00187F207E|nr:aspartate/glutamate racemase family protein [cf. Phormidesmis sp. LEGE 11477]MBE9059627.1 aspartate/glutamate racemase family protein [cf. Phormidesmis sp. LEGE 11477]